MSRDAAPLAPTNPFSTRSIRTGRIPPLDDAGHHVCLTEVLADLAERGGSAAIVGPHGSGKTTLLRHLADAMERRGQRVERVRLHGKQGVVTLLRAVVRGGFVCVDSWERLGRPTALLVRWLARIRGTRLVVTAHRPGPLPTLWACHTSPALLAAIVDRLPEQGGFLPSERPVQIEDAFRRSKGDIREALFMLYDRFEERAGAARAVESPWP
jgi:energy-coupling factor transporter ATP-binding protein EcfA2